MLTRTQVFDTLEKMPEQFSIDQLFDKFLFINKSRNRFSSIRKWTS